MSEQPKLFSEIPDPPRVMSRFEEFLEFHKTTPQVYRRFVELARAVRSRGIERFGARNIWERLRWEYTIEQVGGSPKLNDHHVPYYARLAMLREPGLDGLFVIKDSRFDTDSLSLLEQVELVEQEHQHGGSANGGQRRVVGV